MRASRDDSSRPRLPDATRRSAWLALSFLNPLVRIILIGVYVAGVTFLLFPTLLLGFRLPDEGAIADRDYRATHDFVFKRPNPSLLREQQEAEDAVRPIYRYDPDLGERKSRAVSKVFREARRVLQDHEERLAKIEEERVTATAELEAVHERLKEELARAKRREAGVPPPSPHPREEQRVPDSALPRRSGEGESPLAEQAPPPGAEQIEEPSGAVLPMVGGRSVSDIELAIEEARTKALAIEREAKDRVDATRVELSREIGRAELEFRRQLQLDVALRFDGSAFQALVEDGFSVASEDALQEVIETLMTRRIVRDIERLEDRLHEGIRVIGDERRYTGNDVDLFIELGEARQRAIDAERERFSVSPLPPSPRLQGVLAQLAALLIEENFSFDAAATAKAKEISRGAVPMEIADVYLKGQTIIEAGQRITPRHVAVLRTMQLGEVETRGGVVLGGIAGFVLVLFGLAWWIGREWRDRLRIRQRDVLLFATVVVVELGTLRLSMAVTEGVLTVWQTVPPMAFYYAMPVAAGSMLMRLFAGIEAAIAFAVVESMLAGVLFQGGVARDYVWPLPLVMVLYTIASSVVGAFFLREVRQRTSLLLAGAKVGGVNALLAMAFHLIGGGEVGASLAMLGAGGALGGVLCYFAIIAVTPVLETVLGYATDIKLLELANMNQPALKELSMRAPGTYHHSIMVGNLAEAAAEAIGANPLMTRVGAYYHDLGKMRNPRYFAENQAGENPHDKIKPHMSALIIKAHVKDGIEIARKYRLPQDIVDFIPQHHGSALIGFFYARAKEQAAAVGEDVEEVEFRYPGPRPQRKETALVMLADGVEASARSLSDPNPARLKGLVKKIVNGKFIDGQLDECELTFKDLNAIVDSFNRVLISIYHGRPEYPPIPGEKERARDRLGMDAPEVEHPPAVEGRRSKRGNGGTPPESAKRAAGGSQEPPVMP